MSGSFFFMDLTFLTDHGVETSFFCTNTKAALEEVVEPSMKNMADLCRTAPGGNIVNGAQWEVTRL